MTVGVLGGMGPAATVDFMSLVIALTDADKDQDHVHMIVDHNPHVPDRQKAIAGEREPVETALEAMALRLEAAGADFLVMPCNTAYAFAARAQAAVSIPFLNIIEETVNSLASSATCVGIMATNACLEARIYQHALEASGRVPLLPEPRDQERLMELIFRIKSGDVGESVRRGMLDLTEALSDGGAHAVIAGCTEIPIVLSRQDVAVHLASSSDILARRTIEFAGHHSKK